MIGGIPVRGIVVGTHGIDTALVQLATAQEAATLAQARTEVNVVARVSVVGVAISAMPGSEVYVRDEHGAYLPLGFLTSARLRAEHLDVTSFGDAHRTMLPGPTRLEFVGRSW